MTTMNKTLSAAAAVFVIALALSVGSHGQTPKSGSERNTLRLWQHLALELDARQPISKPETAVQVNRLGDEGWELVAVDSVQEAGTTTRRIMFFKRPH